MQPIETAAGVLEKQNLGFAACGPHTRLRHGPAATLILTRREEEAGRPEPARGLLIEG